MDIPVRNVYNDLQKYGVSEVRFKEMYVDQQGRCGICLERMLSHDCHIDHDHESGLVRRLLCSKCNLGLGLFRDDIRLLARAIVYLEDHGKRY
jgi:hypothetical protein